MYAIECSEQFRALAEKAGLRAEELTHKNGGLWIVPLSQLRPEQKDVVTAYNTGGDKMVFQERARHQGKLLRWDNRLGVNYMENRTFPAVIGRISVIIPIPKPSDPPKSVAAVAGDAPSEDRHGLGATASESTAAQTRDKTGNPPNRSLLLGQEPKKSTAGGCGVVIWKKTGKDFSESPVAWKVGSIIQLDDDEMMEARDGVAFILIQYKVEKLVEATSGQGPI
ncbi:hypothetical protein B0H66DRAFT_570717 [Apodospora peruviana]|uniref:Uncharacterized protein n=1 Tax=Apodospora peruviana TaxID=516989 RepID=A0AAE0HT87_9PEZI|nr:hypothetical protein B0H66DRAFT_570717 [Apodospora peruviana]